MESTALFITVVCLAAASAVLMAVLFTGRKKARYLPDDEYSWRQKPLSGFQRRKN